MIHQTPWQPVPDEDEVIIWDGDPEDVYAEDEVVPDDEEEWAIWYTPEAAAAEYRTFIDKGWSHEDAVEMMGEDAWEYAKPVL